MKKKLSFLLAVVMILSLLPVMSVSANTTNSMTKQPNVSDKQDWSSYTGAEDDSVAAITTGLAGVIQDAPRLKIEAKSDIDVDAEFQIKLNNAEWKLEKPVGAIAPLSAGGTNNAAFGDAITAINTAATRTLLTYNTSILTLNDSPYYRNIGSGTATSIRVTQLSATIASVKVIGGYLSDGDIMEIPLICEVSGAGEVTVSVTGSTVGVNDGTYTVAFGGSGATKTTVSSAPVFADTLSLKEVIIEELRPNSLNGKPIKLVATAGFEWATANSDNLIKITSTGGLVYSNTFNSLPNDTDTGKVLYWGQYGSNQEDREVLYINTNAISTTRSGSLIISGLRLVATDDARYGDVNVTLSGGGVTGETIKVGEYVKYGISLTAEDKDLPVIVAGDYPASWETDRIKTLKVTFAEETVKSWFSTRKTSFTLNDGVKMRGVKFSTIEKFDPSTPDFSLNIDSIKAGNNGNITNSFGGGTAEIAIDDGTKVTTRNVGVSTGGTDKAKFTMQFYVSVEPGYTGDITLTVGGDGVNSEASAVIAKAVNPFTVETSSTDLNLGFRNIPVADILIKENAKGAIKRSGENVYTFYASKDSDGTNYSSTDLVVYVEEMRIDRDSSSVEVVEGDMILDKVEARTSSGALHITIKRESSTPSTLKISGTTVSLDRTLAQGDYEMRIAGIVCANYSDESKLRHATFSKEYFVGLPNYVRVVTPAPSGATIAKVSVTIGGTTLTIGDTTTEMDVEPFIEGGYTMVPARWIAIALGLKESDISFDPNTKTCTILANNRIAQLTSGSNILKLNGSDVPFAGPSAMIRNNRLFVPFRVLGEQVMGVVVGWDEATRTATFNADV